MWGYEILCIDDCSTDGSYEVLKDNSNRYKNVVISRNVQNCGISYTRNELIKKARGKYIWFVDPDDLLYPKVVNLVIDAANKVDADVLLGNYMRIKETTTHLEIKKYLFEPNQSLNLQINEDLNILPEYTNGISMCAIWAGIFKRDFLICNNIFFNEKMIAQEDTLFYYELGLHTNQIFQFKEFAYIYRQRHDSVMHSHNAQRALQYYYSMKEMYRVYMNYYISALSLNRNQLKEKLEHMRQNLALTLVGVNDTSFIREELQTLKKQKIYPYQTNFLQKKRFDKILDYLLKRQWGFWILHFIAKMKLLISKR